jgi:hypothetical protein
MSWTGFSFGDTSSDFGSGDLFSVLNAPSVYTPQSPSNPFPGGGTGGEFPGTGGGPSNPSGSWLSQLLPWANLGAQTFLADQAITSPRPATITYLPNGQLAVTGGGASPVAGAIGSVPSWIWIVLVLLVVVMLFKR